MRSPDAVYITGSLNRVFLIHIPKWLAIPTPISGPSHFATASEVATMDFLDLDFEGFCL